MHSFTVGEYIEFFGGDTDTTMKEYAFLPGNMLDPLRAEFMPIRPAKRFLSCIDGAKKEQAESDIVVDVSVISVFLLFSTIYFIQVMLLCFFILHIVISIY